MVLYLLWCTDLVGNRVSPRRRVWVGRLSCLGVTLLSLLVVPFIPLISNQLYIYTHKVMSYFAPPIAVIFVNGLLWWRFSGLFCLLHFFFFFPLFLFISVSIYFIFSLRFYLSLPYLSVVLYPSSELFDDRTIWSLRSHLWFHCWALTVCFGNRCPFIVSWISSFLGCLCTKQFSQLCCCICSFLYSGSGLNWSCTLFVLFKLKYDMGIHICSRYCVLSLSLCRFFLSQILASICFPPQNPSSYEDLVVFRRESCVDPSLESLESLPDVASSELYVKEGRDDHAGRMPFLSPSPSPKLSCCRCMRLPLQWSLLLPSVGLVSLLSSLVIYFRW